MNEHENDGNAKDEWEMYILDIDNIVERGRKKKRYVRRISVDVPNVRSILTVYSPFYSSNCTVASPSSS